MKIVIINKSDSTGGAAVVSRRLMEALRGEGVDARMLVAERLTDSPYIALAASPRAIKHSFMAERLKIFLANGLNRSTLFKIDTASDGLSLWNHPWVKGADAILLNWVNQGMLSLSGIDRLLRLGKPVVWTMHDMWCLTGICHHAGECGGFRMECGGCPLLGKRGRPDDISHTTLLKKQTLNSRPEKIRYVAVSNWLARKAAESTLLRDADIEVIPNPFLLSDTPAVEPAESPLPEKDEHTVRILFGAARLDDTVKNLPALIAMTRSLNERDPELARHLELITFGNVKDPAALEGIAIPHRHLGMVRGEEKIRDIYSKGDIVVSSSTYETLPGTLVEAQAYGCIPVSFDQGGQSDIVDHLHTGYIAPFSPDPEEGGRRLAEGVRWAAGIISRPDTRQEIIDAMRANVENRFSAKRVAEMYIDLIQRARHHSSGA